MAREDIEDEGLTVSRTAPRVGGNPVVPDKGFRFNGATTFERGGQAGLDARRLAQANAALA